MENNFNNFYTIYTDGGSRGNPGHAGVGGVIFDNDKKVVAEISQYIGIQTNNYAEYKALFLTLKRAMDLSINNKIIDVYMDSLLVVNQLNGKWKVKHNNIIPLYNEIKEILKSFTNITFTHILRNNNKHADTLANKAMDFAQMLC